LEKKLAKQQAEHQQQITAAVIKAQERERSLLGLELHDNVNQVLTTTKLYLEMFLSNMTNDRNILNKAAQYIQNCIDEIRSISKRLSAPTLGNISIKDSLKELVSTINLSNKINIQLIVADLEDYKINQELHIAIYRIVQEQLNNILKHAEASKAWIILTKRNRGLRLLIKDNGKGFDKGAKKEGIGFTNIAFRVEALKGKMSINSELGMGCKIDVFLPLKGEQ
jgi:signal transduction histidine kinase